MNLEAICAKTPTGLLEELKSNGQGGLSVDTGDAVIYLSDLYNTLSGFGSGNVQIQLHGNNNSSNVNGLGFNTYAGGVYSKISAAGTNLTSIYGSVSITNGDGEPCPLLGGFTITNTNANTRWIHWYDSTLAPSSFATPMMSFAIPSGQTLNVYPAVPWSFNYGIAFALSTSGTGFSAVALGDVVLNAQWTNFSNSY